MLILSIRTDKPESEVGLFQDDKRLVHKTWQAHRQLAETLHAEIAKLLKSAGKDWHDIEGITLFQGPGSYTGLRIGASVANALAGGLEIPIIGGQGQAWQVGALQRLLTGESDGQVIPEYGAPAFTTKPKT